LFTTLWCRYEEELLALQSFQHKRLKLEEDLVETKAFIENERLRHKQALQVTLPQSLFVPMNSNATLNQTTSTRRISSAEQ
jgi:hypothetical protein